MSLSTTENILMFLGESVERLALMKLDPFKYEQYLYHRNRREEIESRKRERKNVRQSLSRLMKAGWVIEKGKKYHLTPAGWMRFSIAYSKTVKKQKQRSASGKRKHLIVLFDVPEKQREIRDTFRRLLYSLGFSMFQRSVFIGSNPDAFDVISRIIANADIGDRMKLMVVEKVL